MGQKKVSVLYSEVSYISRVELHARTVLWGKTRCPYWRAVLISGRTVLWGKKRHPYSSIQGVDEKLVLNVFRLSELVEPLNLHTA